MCVCVCAQDQRHPSLPVEGTCQTKTEVGRAICNAIAHMVDMKDDYRCHVIQFDGFCVHLKAPLDALVFVYYSKVHKVARGILSLVTCWNNVWNIVTLCKSNRQENDGIAARTTCNFALLLWRCLCECCCPCFVGHRELCHKSSLTYRLSSEKARLEQLH